MGGGVKLRCPGAFTPDQKKLFSGFPLSVMSRHACALCGARVTPDRCDAGDWIPEPHLVENPFLTAPRDLARTPVPARR